MADVTERAATGADVAHDHERGGAAGEAFPQVRAGRFFTDAVQFVFAQQRLDAVDFRRNRDAHADPVRFLRQFGGRDDLDRDRSEEHTSELQSLMRTSYAVFCLKKKKKTTITHRLNTEQHIHLYNN